MNDRLLHVDSIVKQFETVNAVDRLSFDIHRGEIFALLGPNGAGKTTTVRMLLGITKPDSGTISYAIGNSNGGRVSPFDLGYLPEDRGLYRDIPVVKTLTYMGVLRGLERDEAHRRAEWWLKRVELADRAHHKLETLSKGNQQKVQFISSILHKPAFAILDEPFSGLDPINQEFFIDIIRELRDQGTTILLCAHQMDLVERLADRVLLINRGREVLSGTIAQIKEQSAAASKVVVTVTGNASASVGTALERSPIILSLERTSDNEIVFYLKKGEPLHQFLADLASSLEIVAIHTEKITLHEIFIRAVGQDTEKAL
jgi:ABC-2 type transport system ATP-binding protein